MEQPPSSATVGLLGNVTRWRESSKLFIEDNFGPGLPIGLDPWQVECCEAWDRGDIRIALCACKGPGKSAILAMLIWHFLATRRQSKVAATSISGDNLRDCLWTELAKWQQYSPFLLAAFEWQKERIIAKDKPDLHWASARTWSKSADVAQQADTLAGLHADYILFVIDESGGVPDAVAVSAEAALASGKESRFLIAGNPTECQGPLWNACNRDRALWTVINITGDPDDPKRSRRIKVDWARQQIAQHGANNPWVLANVFGKFPPSSPNVFIPGELVREARKRPAVATMFDAFTIAVDIARFGDDEAVITFKKGLDARTHPAIRLRNLDNMQLAARVADEAIRYKADAVFVDGGGNGGGVVDRLMQLNIPNVFEIQFGGKSDRVAFEGDTAVYDNKAAEMWGRLRTALKHLAIEDSDELENELTQRQYFFNQRYGRDAIALESKDHMKKRGLASPSWADSLCLVAGTMIATPSGQRQIESLSVGDVVHTPFGPTRVGATWKSLTEKITTATFSNGSVLRGKGSHKVFVWGKDGACQLDALSFTIEVEPLTQWRLFLWRGASLLFTGARSIGFRETINISTQGTPLTVNAFCIGAFGLTKTALYRKAMSCITKTTTQLITTLTIFSYFPTQNTKLCTWSREENSLDSPNGWNTCANWQSSRPPSGMGLKRGLSGTLKMPKKSGRIANLWARCVQFATRHFGLTFLTELNFVQPHAGRLEHTENIQQTAASATGVVKSFLRTVIGLSRVVPSNVLTEKQPPTFVYNLTLERHNAYYANGILVYNCMHYAYPVQPHEHAGRDNADYMTPKKVISEYDPYAEMHGTTMQ